MNTQTQTRRRILIGAVIALLGIGATAGVAEAHHIEGTCDGLIVTDTPLVTQDGQTQIAPVGFTPWSTLGTTTVTGWQKGGAEGPKTASRPEDCAQEETTTTTVPETTTTAVETTTTIPETTTTVADATTTTTAAATTTVAETTLTVLADTTTTTIPEPPAASSVPIEIAVYRCADFRGNTALADQWRTWYLSIGRPDLAAGVTGCTTATLPATGPTSGWLVGGAAAALLAGAGMWATARRRSA